MTMPPMRAKPDHKLALVPNKPAVKPAPAMGSANILPKIKIEKNDPTAFGRKVVLYGPAGAGKSSLLAQIEGNVIIDLNRGLTGLPVQVIRGATSFNEVRSAVKQCYDLIPDGGTLSIDTVSEVDEFIIDHLKVMHGKDSVVKLGYDKFPGAVETLRLLLSDFDALLRRRVDIVLVAHESTINYKNALGDDYRQIGPRLLHSANDSCRDAIVSWADHVFRVALADAQVETQVDRNGKVISGKARQVSTERFIRTDGTQSMIAKSRPVLVGGQFHRMPSLIAFSGPQDNSLWEGLNDPRIFNAAEDGGAK